MNKLIIFGTLIGLVVSDPNGAQVVNVKQDNLGNYNLQYAADGIARIEQRTVDGSVNGGFSYIDPHGILRSTAFTSGQHGFHAVSPDIPVPVQDTPEVALAKAQHLAALRNAHLANGHTLIPEGQFVQQKTVVAATPNVAFETVPVTRVEKIVEKDVPLFSTKFVQEIPETHKFVELPAVRTSHISVNSGDKLISADIPLLKTNQFTFQVPTEKLIKTDIPLFRTNNVVSEKLIETEVPLVRSSHVAIESSPTKLVNTEIPVFRTSNIELKSIPFSEKLFEAIPTVRSSDFTLTQAKVEVPTERRIIETELPLRSSHLKLETVETPKTLFEIPTSHLRFASIESPNTFLKYETIESPKTRLEIPSGTHLRLESVEPSKTHIEIPARSEFVTVPRSAIGLDSLRLITLDDKSHVLKFDGDLKSSLSSILLRQ
ncbi:hypothetical protein RN001_003377 [Aquatica leii]|uniref:Cuticle protein n=1 Tax=Aquatica leii TaxID=1421715 RepID=A0AAN7PR24_9COLE|nr:hypothetical protein RN001_003377 [Aquatica leii]